MTFKKPYKNITNQEVRPFGIAGTPIKKRYLTTIPIDTCRYRDGYDREIESYLRMRNGIMNGLKKGRQAFLPGRFVLRNCDPLCRLCPHVVTFKLPNRKQTKKITATKMLAAAPESEWVAKGHPSLSIRTMGERARIAQVLFAEEEKVQKIMAIEREMMEFTDLSIDFMMCFFAELDDTILQPYEDHFFCRYDLRDAEVCGFYQPLWGMRMDILLSMLRVAYRVLRYRLHAYYSKVLGGHSPKWSGLILPSPAGRTTLDIPRWRWVYIFYVQQHGNLTEKIRKEIRRNGEVYRVRVMPTSGPDYKTLGDPDLARFRRSILAAKERIEYLDAISDEAERLLWRAKKELWDSRKKKAGE
ncbi:hypothetical protein [Acidithiobacillus thiooxidans]|uniref:hypothetical protein n=1 Tax=Acidithiobacillus thiooxidans TaxID=930 RepID=UPI0009D95B78|nr:hypothetical protein [Acidithiobacillus thiooxidans]